MDTAAFDYDLPVERIAQVPVEPRDSARLLVDRGTEVGVEHRTVHDLPDLVAPGDLVVVNTTRVLPARLPLVKPTGGAAEVLLVERAAGTAGGRRWYDPAGGSRPGTRLRSDRTDAARPWWSVRTWATGSAWSPSNCTGSRSPRRSKPPARCRCRPTSPQGLDDPERYQTVYAERAASAAAPTAGLHLTPAVLETLTDRGIGVATVELVVGLGTFRPMTAAKVEDHTMHAERYRVPEATMAAIGRTHDARGAGGGRGHHHRAGAGERGGHRASSKAAPSCSSTATSSSRSSIDS